MILTCQRRLLIHSLFRCKSPTLVVSQRKIFRYVQCAEYHRGNWPKYEARGGYRGKQAGHGPDTTRIRISKNMSRILRHDAASEGIRMRQDGYVRVTDLLVHPSFQNVDIIDIQEVVKSDSKNRFHIYSEPDTIGPAADALWICANQGHSIQNVETGLKRITNPSDIPMAVHGTTETAWKSISKHGLSRMGRNHIHLASGVPGSGVMSGIRDSSRVLIYVAVGKAMLQGIQFFESRNGVILTPGNAMGYLEPQFFRRVEKVSRTVTKVAHWEEREPVIVWEEGTAVANHAAVNALHQAQVPQETNNAEHERKSKYTKEELIMV